MTASGMMLRHCVLALGVLVVSTVLAQNPKPRPGVPYVATPAVTIDGMSRLAADRLSFVVIEPADRKVEAALHYEGVVNGEVNEGRLARGADAARSVVPWRAVKVAR